MTYSVVFRTLDRDKFVAFGDERGRLPVYAINEDGLMATRMNWPGCTRFLDVFIDQMETDQWSESEILERYGGMKPLRGVKYWIDTEA